MFLFQATTHIENFIFYRQIKGDENLLLSKDYDSSSMGRLSCIDVATIFAEHGIERMVKLLTGKKPSQIVY